MSIYQNVKAKQLQARKDKQHPVYVATLTTLIGESSKLSKDSHGGDPTDAEMIVTIKKFLKNISETLSHLDKNSEENLHLTTEKNQLEEFLPKQLSKEEIRLLIIGNGFDLADKKIMGSIMSFFKANHAGLYDAKLVQEVIKELQV